MRKNKIRKNLEVLAVIMLVSSITAFVAPIKNVRADDEFANSLALALLSDPSVLIDASYSDTDSSGNRMAKVVTSLGIMSPTHGSDFILISSGIAGDVPVTTNNQNPGSEEGCTDGHHPFALCRP